MKSPNILLSIFAAVTMTFGVSTSTLYAQCPADLNGDGQINQADVAQLLANSGPVPFPPPAGPSTPTWATLLEAAPDPAVVTDANLRAAIVASGFAWRIKDTSSNIEMLLVPGGTFMMGCSESTQSPCGYFDETPTHQVTLTQAFYIGRYEVTQAQWTAKMGSNPSFFVPANGYSSDTTKPVESITWDMIASGSTSFMSLTGLRLPTEAEWEYAYRAGTTTAFHSYAAQPNGFNDDILLGNIAWFNDGGSGSSTYGTKAVGGKLANGLGLHDMSGNVWEWCQDLYGPYSSGSVTNPTGPTTGTLRVLRGGDWGYWGSDCRGSVRNRNTFYGTVNVGFRAARNP
jgi:formylglycine-generating enzyme required for sulfatase activity